MPYAPILSQGVGYGMVVGIGLFFSVFMIGVSKIQTRYTSHSPGNSEEFNSASRSVKPGLIATGIVSAWTWAATLLQSSAVGYKFGISGPFWYAAGATVQVLLFAQLAAKLKLNAPYANTFVEIIGVRWPGKAAHLTFLFFALLTNCIVSTMLILGGSATVNALTGMNTIAACFLIPTGVAIYVVVGGMRATLIADYSHTMVLFIIVLLFMFTVYATSDIIGSPAKMHDLLSEISRVSPVADNAKGSYLTMRSKGGIIFGVLNLIGNFGTVFGDQAYWQRAIASTPQTAVKAYLIGGLAWFSIPFGLATTLGLAARALKVDLTAAQVGAGLPAPAAASALLGKGGAGAMLLLLFLAITSATSAELVAVSSLFTYDVYKKYVNKNPTDQQKLMASHFAVLGFSIIMGILGLIFFYIGISMGFLYELMGCLIGSAIVPVAIAITWKKANKWGCITGAFTGLCLGLMAWLVVGAKLNDNHINITILFGDYPMLAGNCVALCVGGIIAMSWSLISPENFDFDVTRAMNYKAESKIESFEGQPTGSPTEEKDDEKKTTTAARVTNLSETDGGVYNDGSLPEIDYVGLNRAFRFAAWSSIVLTLVLLILIPFPLFFTHFVFGKKSFATWVVVSMIWAWLAAIVVVIYPVWEARKGLGKVARGIYLDVFHGGTGAYVPGRK